MMQLHRDAPTQILANSLNTEESVQRQHNIPSGDGYNNVGSSKTLYPEVH